MKSTRSRTMIESISHADRGEKKNIKINKWSEKDDATFVGLLRVCAKDKDLDKGILLHDKILKRGILEKNPYLGGSVIHMYAKCEMLKNARKVLEELLVRSVFCWNAMITGYAQQGQFNEAFYCFHQMQSEGLFPNAITYTCILKACGKTVALCKGEQIHNNVASCGLLENDIMLGNALVGMYVNCGMIDKARKVLKELPLQDVVSWSILIVAYAQQGETHEALDCYERMQNEGIYPDEVTFICMLKACGSKQYIEKGKQIHSKALCREFMEKDIRLGAALVDMYVKCHALVKAQQLLERLPIRDVVCWNALISGYAQHGHCNEAWNCLKRMQREGLSPDSVTFIGILKACGSRGAIDKGKEIHDKIWSTGLLDKDIVLGNSLVDMYAKFGMLERAKEVLEGLPTRDEVSWNALITGYAQHGQFHQSLDCFRKMQHEGIYPNVITFVCLLNACGSIGAIDEGKQIHVDILSRGLLEKHIVLGNALVDMYAQCHMLAKAQQVLEEIPLRDVASWNALIAAYAQQGQCHEAFKCIQQMQSEDISPDAITFICIMKACGRAQAIEKGKQVHENVVSTGLLEHNIVLGNALVDMYAKCGAFEKSQKVLDELLVRNVVSWNALIAGFVQWGQCHDALKCFEQMENEGLSPVPVTYICVLKACGSISAIDKGKQIHEEIVNKGLLENFPTLGNAVMDMYAKCGEFTKAEEVLKELVVQDTISWNTLIAGYADQGRCHEAMHCFEEMQNCGISPDAITFISIAKVCGSLGSIEKGKQIHNEIVSRGLLEQDIVLGIALVDMYAKCGVLVKAWNVLEELPIRDVIAWNALIAGYAQQGRGHESVTCFEQMQSEGVSPDEVTMLSVLNACCHSGLVDVSQMLFESMTKKYGIIPNEEHHTCMVVVFGYSGHLEKAMSMINGMPSRDYPPVWLALLASCKKWGNVKLSRVAFDQILILDDGCASAYALMIDIFMSAGLQEDAEKVDAMRLKYSPWKKAEKSLQGEDASCYSMKI